MGVYRSPAVIMRIKDLGEADLLVGFFTQDRGRLKGIAKNARRSRRRFANCLDLFSLVNMEYEMKGSGDLYFLHSCRLLSAHGGLRSDYGAYSLASYMVELTEVLFPVGVADKHMFTLLKGSLENLGEGNLNRRRILFESRAMGLGGYAVNLGKCLGCGRVYQGEGRGVFVPEKGGLACLKCARETEATPGLKPATVEALESMQTGKWSTAEVNRLSEQAVEDIQSVLRLHITYQLGRRIKTAGYVE